MTVQGAPHVPVVVLYHALFGMQFFGNELHVMIANAHRYQRS